MTDTGVARIDSLIELGRYDDVVRTVQALMAEDGAAASDGGLWCRLSLAYLRLERDVEALEAAGHAAALLPDSDWPHRLASHALESLGRNDEAVRAAAESVRLAPYTWQGHARFAATLSASGGDLQLARQAANHAVSLAPNEPDAHSAMGLVALRQGDYQTAEKAFRHVLSLQPDHHSALNNLAVVQLRHRDLDGALSGFSAAIRSDPSQEVARRNVDSVVRAVLYRAQWFVFVAAYLARQVLDQHDGGHRTDIGRPARIAVALGVAALAGLGAWWSLQRIPRGLRPYAWSVVRRSRVLFASAIVTIAAFCALLAVPIPSGPDAAATLAAVAAGLALVGILLSMAARGARPRFGLPFRRKRKL